MPRVSSCWMCRNKVILNTVDQNNVHGLQAVEKGKEVSSVFYKRFYKYIKRQNFVICITQHLNQMQSLKDRDTFFRLKIVSLKIFVIFTHNIKTSHNKSRNQEKSHVEGGGREGRESSCKQERNILPKRWKHFFRD